MKTNMLRPSKILSKGLLSDNAKIRIFTLKFMDLVCTTNICEKTFDTISSSDGFWDGRKDENINKIPVLDNMYKYLNSQSKKEKSIILLDLKPESESIL
jgi:hypothetical protein